MILMPDLHQRIASFRGNVFPRQAELYRRLLDEFPGWLRAARTKGIAAAH